MKKKLAILVGILMMLTVMSAPCIAETVQPCADLYFDSASAFLTSNKVVVFDCVAYDIYERIAITNVWLEQKVNDTWVYVKALTPPSYVSINMPDYGAEVDYSASITGKGTFRVGFTVDADGYAISRYSNTRTF